jgi:hypothetical protein
MSERKMPVNSSRRVDMHAFVEVGVQVGSRLCSYGSATASQHCVVVHRHERARPAEDHGGCLDYFESG